MDLVFLGHQSWLVAHRDTTVLLDPVLAERFGHSEGVEFRVYPPRRVDVSRMPAVDAVILSHEHLDHFHLPSLDRLPRTVPFHVGTMMPACVTRAIEKLGFEVRRVPLCRPVRIGDLEIVLYPGGGDTVFWERRVTQVLLTPVDAPELATFIGVDALVSATFVGEVKAGRVPSPMAVIVANNSQHPPPGAVGAYSNLLPVPSDRLDPAFPGIGVLQSTLVDYLADLPDVRHAILCGNGFVNLGEAFGPFLFSDNQRLARLANELGSARKAYGPRPGERLELWPDGTVHESSVPWVAPDEALEWELLERQRRFLAQPVNPPFRSITGGFDSEEAALRGRAVIEQELVALGRALLVSAVGRLAFAADEYLSGPTGSARVLFRFLEGPEGRPCQYAFDFAESRFVRDETPAEELLETFPFGLEAHMSDVVAVVEGRLQIWDLAGNALRSWFLGSIYENLVVFLYEQYGEQVRPDLAERVYDGAIHRLRAAREAEPAPSTR